MRLRAAAYLLMTIMSTPSTVMAALIACLHTGPRAGPEATMRACASASTPQLESPDTRLRLTPARAATRAPLSVSSRRPGWPFGKDISGRTRLSPDGTSPFLLRSVCSATSRGQYALCDCGCCDFKNDARALMEIAEMQGCAYSCSAGKAAKLSKFVRPM